MVAAINADLSSFQGGSILVEALYGPQVYIKKHAVCGNYSTARATLRVQSKWVRSNFLSIASLLSLPVHGPILVPQQKVSYGSSVRVTSSDSRLPTERSSPE